LDDSFDYVITVCDDAKENCPYFSGNVSHRMHLGFEDPAKAQGTSEEILTVYRKIRDKIREEFLKFYKTL
jgi:arsenate reductase